MEKSLMSPADPGIRESYTEDFRQSEVLRLQHKLPDIWRKQHLQLVHDPAIAQWGQDVVTTSVAEIETVSIDQYPKIDPAVLSESPWGRLLTSSPEDLAPLFRVEYSADHPGWEVYHLVADICSKRSLAIVPDVGRVVVARNPSDQYPYGLRENRVGLPLERRLVEKIVHQGQRLKALEEGLPKDVHDATVARALVDKRRFPRSFIPSYRRSWTLY